MRMTAICGREEERERKIRRSWQKQHGRITQLFFIHSPLHSHMISKVPKPRGTLPANSVCQFFKPVTPVPRISSCRTKRASSSMQLLLRPRKVNTWGGSVHYPSTMHRSQIPLSGDKHKLQEGHLPFEAVLGRKSHESWKMSCTKNTARHFDCGSLELN